MRPGLDALAETETCAMTTFTKIPTHMDYCHDMARVAAQMAGYDFDELFRDYSNPLKRELRAGFMSKAMAAVKRLGPAVVDLDPVGGEKVPERLRRAGDRCGHHPLRTVREWRGLSIEALAERAGLSVELVTSIEARKVRANEMHEFALASVLNVSPHALTDWRADVDLDRHEMVADMAAGFDVGKLNGGDRASA